MEERQRHRHRVWPSPQRACCRSCDGEGRPWRNNSQNPDESKTSEAGQLWRWSSLPFAWLPPPSSSSSPSPFSPPPLHGSSPIRAQCHMCFPLARWDDLAFLCGAPSRHVRAESEWRRAMWPPPSLLLRSLCSSSSPCSANPHGSCPVRKAVPHVALCG